MIGVRRVARDEQGVAAIEMAFALPLLLTFMWMFMQFAQLYRALAGIQQALGEGARYATLCVSPTAVGCTTPSTTLVRDKISASVYGIGPGTFGTPTVTKATSGSANYYDLTVTYSQTTDMLFFQGPTVNLTRSKRVWVAA